VVKTDTSGTKFLGFTLKWNYLSGYVDLSMPGYLQKALDKLQYKLKTYPQYSPHQHHPINYSRQKGERPTATEIDTSPLLPPNEIVYIQQAVGLFLYYGRALDSTMLTALNDIGTQQAFPTTKVKAKVQQLLDYANTYKNVFVRYYASDMQLHVDTDAAYLVLPKAKSRIAGYFRLLHHKDSSKFKPDNGPLYILCKTLRYTVSSAAEAETHGVFHNAKCAIPIAYLLTQMGHTQKQPILIRTDNSTSAGFVNRNMQMKMSKTWDMQLHWLQDGKFQKHFNVFWDKGMRNGADYHTKHHPPSYH
jgi:hypothetical protein